MLDYKYLVSIAIILLSTKIFGGLTEKIKLPQVVGALIAGVVIGPAVFGIVQDTAFLDEVAGLGVIILMFMAGLDTDLNQLKKKGVSYLVIAIFGVVIPLVGGFLSYFWYFNINPGDGQNVLKAIFIGVILTATSVSITVEGLRELGHLTGKVGNAILGAAIVDDVIGIIILTVITSFRDSSISIGIVLIKIVLYFVIMLVFGLIITAGARMLDLKTDRRQITVYVFALVLIVAYISEKYVGIADITGAYLIGMIFSKFSIRNEIVKKMNVLSYLFFSPIFFASVGLKTKLDSFSTSMIVFSVIILLVAIFTKIIGAGVGAKLCKYSLKDSLNIGIGMVSRGEVALIVAQKGHKLGFIDNNMFSPIVLMVVITTILTPILLKISMPKIKEDKDVSLKPMTIE